MPIGNPVEGELWESREPLSGRTMRGVIAEASPTIVTLVSTTGNRLRVAPGRMVQNWSFASNPPRTPFVCSRRGCASSAAFTYMRGTSPDYVCARHAPVGIRLDWVDDQPGTVPEPIVSGFQEAMPCWNCGNLDPVEVPDNTRPHGTSAWSCLACNNYWVVVTNTGVRLSERNLGQWWLDVLQLTVTSTPQFRNPTAIRCHPTVVSVLRATLANLPIISAQIMNQPEMLAISTVPVTTDPTLAPWTAIVQTTTHHIVPTAADINTVTRDILRRQDAAANLISVGSRWSHLSTGQVFDVVAVKDGSVSFRKDAQAFTMLQDDFLQLHRPFQVETSAPLPPPSVELHPGEEWESDEGVAQIVNIDSKRELVYVRWLSGTTGSSRPLSLRQFATSKWRKIERRTAYQRIMDDDED